MERNPSIKLVGDGRVNPDGEERIYVTATGNAVAQAPKGTFDDEITLALNQIGSFLEASAMTLHDVVACTCYISDSEDGEAVDTVFRRLFQPHFPARTVLKVRTLKGSRVSIDAVAYKRRPVHQGNL